MMGRPSGAGPALLALAAWTGCAKQQPPPGSPPDQLPPRVESIEPQPDSIVPGFEGSVRLRFDEPVNVPSDLERRLFASPMERYEVESGFADIRFRPRDGWRDSIVYCFEIPDGISDLLRNRMAEPTEFCFSTGPAVSDTRVTGVLMDAITGLPVNEGRVLFYAPDDTTAYGAVSDQEGEFSARALPPSEYQAFGFVDQNRNLRLDRDNEAHDSTTFVAAPGATPRLRLRAVPPDTSPPRLLRIEAVDSVTIQLEFDDPLLTPAETEPRVTVRDSASGLEIGVVAARVGLATEVDLPPLPGDSSAAPPEDSLAAVPDSLSEDPFGEIEPEVPPEERLPSRYVSARTASPLRLGTYRVSAEGVVNLRRLAGGGDTTFVVDLEPGQGAGDTLGLPSDTLGLPPDTLGLPPDTLGLPPDTLAAPPDTLHAADPRGGRRETPGLAAGAGPPAESQAAPGRRSATVGAGGVALRARRRFADGRGEGSR